MIKKSLIQRKVTLITNPSEHAIAVILSQEGQLTIYLSRKLMAVETNYLNFEKEALAIVWSIEKVQNF